MQTDQDLLARVKKNDDKALEVLFERYYYALCHFSCKWVKSPDLSQEVVSEVFALFWINRKSLPDIENLQAYLYKATRNKALNLLKKENRFDNLTENQFDCPSLEFNGFDKLIFEEVNHNVKRLIDSMPTQRRKVFLMNRIDGLRYKKIAEILNISERTVQNHMVQALKYINAQLSLK